MNILREIGKEYRTAENIMLAEVKDALYDMGIANCHHDRKNGLLLVYSGPSAGDRLLFEISASVHSGRIVIRCMEKSTPAKNLVPACRLKWRKDCCRKDLARALTKLMAFPD